MTKKSNCAEIDGTEGDLPSFLKKEAAREPFMPIIPAAFYANYETVETAQPNFF